MRKIIVLAIGCLLLTGCSSSVATTINCSIEEWYMMVGIETQYDKNDNVINLKYSVGADYESFGEELLDTGYESAMAEVDTYNSYKGVSYEVVLDGLVLTGTFNIDLTTVSEEDLALVGFTLDELNLTPDEFVADMELQGATCVKK